VNLTLALAKLKQLPSPVARTNDAAAVWQTSPATASQMLARLAKAGHIVKLVRGLWLLDPSHQPWTLHPFVTDPAPSYLSLQTALFHHGMIEQIPSLVHVVSTTKSKTTKTPVGTFVIHQVAPAFFTDFEPFEKGPAQIATPEKALVDFFYFRPTRSRSFRSLPELELPKTFKKKKAKKLAKLIVSRPRRAMVERLLHEVFLRLKSGKI